MIWHVRVEGPLINDHDIAVAFSKHSRVLALELDKARSGAKGSLRQGLPWIHRSISELDGISAGQQAI